MMFAGCHPLPWPHHRHSIREENNNNIKSFPYFGKIKMDKTSDDKSPKVYRLEGRDQIFNITDFRDEKKMTPGVQNLSQHFSIENLVTSSSNTLHKSINHKHNTSVTKHHNTSVTKHHKPKQSNGYSIREILKPKQDSIPELDEPDQGSQVVDGEKEQNRCSNGEKGKEILFENDCTYLRQFHPNMNITPNHSAFSIPNPSRITENFMHNLPSNSSLPVEFLMGNNHTILRGEQSYDPCPYLSDTQSQHISFDAIRHQTISPLSGHFDDLSSSPPLTSMARCHRDRKKFQCPQCRYITDRKNNLMRHIITMHQESGKVLECCGIAFQSKAALREHNSVFHSGGYRCQICSRNFCRKALLRRHLTVHSGQKDFFCDLCGYATSHKSNLERHQKVHNKRHNRINLLNTSTVSYGSIIINNSNHNINTHHTFTTNKLGTAAINCGRNMERTTSPTFLHSNFSSNDDCDSDCDIIDVDSLNEHNLCVSATVCPSKTSTSDHNFTAIAETKDIASLINPQKYSRPKKLKRRGLFVSRIQDTYDIDSRPCLDRSYQHHSIKKRHEIKHSIKDILGADSENVKGNKAVTCFNMVNDESSLYPTGVTNVDNTNDDTVNEKEENDIIQPGDEHGVLDLKLRPFNGNSPRKCKIYPLLYLCYDCRLEFPNQILYDSHTCSSKNTNYGDVIAIPIVMAVQKGRIRQSNAMDLTI